MLLSVYSESKGGCAIHSYCLHSKTFNVVVSYMTVPLKRKALDIAEMWVREG